MTKIDFLAWETASRDTIDVKRCYCDMAGDLVAGIILSEIVYWHLPKKGDRDRSRLRVVVGDELRLAKNLSDWWEECRVSPKQAATGLGKLKTAGLISMRNGMFNGKKTPMIGLCWKTFLTKLDQVVKAQGESKDAKPIVTKRRYRSYRKVAIGGDETLRPLTETTSLDYARRGRAGEGKPA